MWCGLGIPCVCKVRTPNSGWFLIVLACIFSLLFQQTLNITELLTAWLVCSSQSVVVLRQAARRYRLPSRIRNRLEFS